LGKSTVHALVTGGAGFIGSHLVEALVRGGAKVRVVDDLSQGRLENLAKVYRQIEFIHGDLRDTALMRRAMRQVHWVFHQAALRSVPKSVRDPLLYHDINATGTLKLLLLACETGVGRFIHASSSSVYGNQTSLPEREDLICRPQSPYAVSKLVGELYGEMMTRLTGLQTVGLRYFNVFGPRQPLEGEYAVVVPRFITAILKGRPVPIHGDGRQTRDFTYVDDVVQANLKAARAQRVAGEVFNVGAGNRHSVRELARLLGKILKRPVMMRFLPERPGDVRHTQADLSKAMRRLGYRPSVSFQEGLRRTALWFMENRQVWDTKAR
jgi:UDP-glucose 4-epimerase